MRLVALLFVALLVPLAGAQLEPPVACGKFTLTHTAPQSAVEGGVGVSVTVVVTNGGNLPATVNVSAATGATGWRVSPSGQEVTVNAGQKGNVLFTVIASQGAAESATLNFAGAAVCTPPGGLPCPSGCTAQTTADSVTITLAPEAGFRIPGLDALNFPLEYLLAGLVLIAIAIAIPLLLRKRKGAGALLACPEPLKHVRPGKGVSFPIEVKNPSDKPARITLGVGIVPEGWSAFLPLPEVQLAEKEARSLWLMVRAPPDATPGQAIDVRLTATDAARADRPIAIRVRAEVKAETAETQG